MIGLLYLGTILRFQSKGQKNAPEYGGRKRKDYSGPTAGVEKRPGTGVGLGINAAVEIDVDLAFMFFPIAGVCKLTTNQGGT